LPCCAAGRTVCPMRRTSRGDASYAAALARPEFRAIFAAATLAITGTVISAVVLTVLVFERTRSPLLSSLTFTLGFMPYVFAGTLLSGIVDRVPPRRLLASCSLGSAGLTAAMAFPRMPVAVLLMLLVGTGALGGMASATQGALVRSVVPEVSYVPARSLIRIASQVAQVGGNPVGGLLLVALSPSGAFLISSAGLVTAASLARFGLGRYPVTGAADGTALLRDSLRGVRHVFSHVPLRRLLLLGWLVPMFSVAPEALAAPYIAGQNGSPALVGWWLAALPIGLIAGDLLGVWCLSPQRQRRVVGLAAAASFVPYLAFFATPPIAVALPLLAGAGTGGMYSLGLDSLVRQAAPEHLFARTMAVNTAGLLALQALGFALAGAVAGIIGPGRAIAGAGLCGIVIVICLRPRKREMRSRAPHRELTSPQGGLAIDDAELTSTDQEARRHAGRNLSPGQDLFD
jgi:predicted MFS family arabinose efflux permease